MTADQYVDRVFRRIGKGKPQSEAGIYRNAIQSMLTTALQRLADRIARDPRLYTILQYEYTITLSTYFIGQASVALSTFDAPALLISKEAQQKWFFIMSGVRFPVQRLNSIRDLYNPPPTPDYYFYTVHEDKIVVVDSNGQATAEVSGFLFANYVPDITNTVFDDNKELADDLIEVGVALALESQNPAEVVRHAEKPNEQMVMPQQ